MPYFFWKTPEWFEGALCCRYLVVRFGKIGIPMLEDGATVTSEWHWALGFFTDGQCQVLGAWRDEGAGTAQRIATDLNERGIERIKSIAADDDLVKALGSLRPKAGRSSTDELAESGAFGPRMRRVIRWTDTAGQQLQVRMSRVARAQQPFADQAAAANFIAQAFQRADRDLLHDRWDRKCPTPFGQAAFVGSVIHAA